MTNELTRAKLLAFRPCQEACEWMASLPDASIAELWQQCERGDWMMWLIVRSPGGTPRLAVQLACALVRRTPLGDGRTVWDLLTDERSRNAIEVVEAWLRGEATDEQLRAAAYAARTADATTYAAYAARTADATTYAVDAAARTADATTYAAYAARAADAATYAVDAVARAAARAAQAQIIREIVPDVQALWREAQQS